MNSKPIELKNLQDIPYIGEAKVDLLNKVGIFTVRDLLYHFPFRYEDTSEVVEADQLDFEDAKTVKAKVIGTKTFRTKRGKVITIADFLDDKIMFQAIWFNQLYLQRTLKSELELLLFGKLNSFGNKTYLYSPKFEILKNNSPIHLGRITPVYPETSGLTSAWLRSRLKWLIKQIQTETYKPKEVLKKVTLKRNSLIELNIALKYIHEPNNFDQIKIAQTRFAFEELFQITKASFLKKKEFKKYNAPEIKAENSNINEFIHELPFELTKAQQNSLNEILKDIRQSEPMHRLLQGDTGSGKTIVAAIAALTACQANYNAVLMAPTTILADQHYTNISKLFAKQQFEIIKLTSDTKLNLKKTNKPRFYIGTHAILHKKEIIDQIGLLIIDEEHRFGVDQREDLLKLKIKENYHPHYLNMSATPIPRSLALTIWGDFDISVIDELPKGRIKPDTYIIPPQKRLSAYQWLKEIILEKGQQMFVVCPLIEESEKLELKSAKETFQYLSKEIYPHYKLELLHGKLKSTEKERILQDFKDKKIDIIVATSVVEVGIDVPNATAIIIEDADRYGLAQLHQMRGRVGRGKEKSYCLLFKSKNAEEQDFETRSEKRLQFFKSHYDAFELAEFDLKQRGPGEFFGTKQTGLPALKMASIFDTKLIEKVRREVEMEYAK